MHFSWTNICACIYTCAQIKILPAKLLFFWFYRNISMVYLAWLWRKKFSNNIVVNTAVTDRNSENFDFYNCRFTVAEENLPGNEQCWLHMMGNKKWSDLQYCRLVDMLHSVPRKPLTEDWPAASLLTFDLGHFFEGQYFQSVAWYSQIPRWWYMIFPSVVIVFSCWSIPFDWLYAFYGFDDLALACFIFL